VPQPPAPFRLLASRPLSRRRESRNNSDHAVGSFDYHSTGDESPAPRGWREAAVDVASSLSDIGQGCGRLAGGEHRHGSFSITVDRLMRETGLSTERIQEYARQGFAWAWPNVLLGPLVIVPIWVVVFPVLPQGKSN
jgi:hypothetical protein